MLEKGPTQFWSSLEIPGQCQSEFRKSFFYKPRNVVNDRKHLLQCSTNMFAKFRTIIGASKGTSLSMYETENWQSVNQQTWHMNKPKFTDKRPVLHVSASATSPTQYVRNWPPSQSLVSDPLSIALRQELCVLGSSMFWGKSKIETWFCRQGIVQVLRSNSVVVRSLLDPESC